MRASAVIVTAAALSQCDARVISLRVSTTPFRAADPKCTGIGNVWTALTDQCLCKPCDLCKYSFTAGECRPITLHAESSSDGSEISIQQPELAADKWFLTQDEMTTARGGVARDPLRLWTPHNNVTMFVGTNEYFDAVYGDFEVTKPSDNVWITGWSFDDVVLRPEAAADKVNDTKVLAVFQRLVNKGVDLHILGWTNFFESSQNVAFQKLVNALEPKPRHGDAYFVFDDRLPDATASHHQKTVAIKRAQGIVAYVGGIDLTWDRWDTIYHNVSELRTRTGIERDNKTHGWMDCHLRIDGPAASDVAHNFLQRWNMKRKPLEDLLDPLLPFEDPSYSNLADLNTGEPLVENENGHHAVQVVRTYSCKYDHYDEVAPHGEISIFHSRLKAIKLAKNYVYIEDQYFTHVPQLLDALLEVLPRLQRVIIVSQPASSDTSKTGYNKYQWQMIQPLVTKYPNKVKVYRPKPERGVYIHTKLVIVDDVFVSISSSNWNRRSMTTDTEMGANIVDQDIITTPDGIKANKLANDYRTRKFMELTGQPYDAIAKMKLRDALAAVEKAVGDPHSLITRHEPKEDATFLLYPDDVRDIADPLGLCDSKRLL